jgi:hypothetical protein
MRLLTRYSLACGLAQPPIVLDSGGFQESFR